MQQRQPKGLSCVNGYGIVAFMPMGREKPRDYNSNDMHKMSRSFVIPKYVELFCHPKPSLSRLWVTKKFNIYC